MTGSDTHGENEVLALSRRQLDAYNRTDLDAFCDCYHPEVTVLGEDGAPTMQGIEAFRARYGAMFAAHRDVHAEVSERMLLGPHVVERERWSRVERATGTHRSGEIFVRYTAREGRIRWAQFLAGDAGLAPKSNEAGGRVVVVAGTGTDVGKTYVTAALLAHLRSAGVNAAGYKPVATGVDPRCDDAELHASASGRAVLPPTYAYVKPVSPHLAALEEKRPIELAPMVARAHELARECEVLFVELAGGLFSPLGPALDNAAYVAALGPARVVLVAPDRLGVLHEVSAVALAMQARGVSVPTVVALSAPEKPDASTGLNADSIEALGLARVGAVFARERYEGAAAIAQAARLYAALG